MEEESTKKRASIVSVIIIFLILILIAIFAIKKINADSVTTDELSLLNPDSPEYIASKKVEINSYVSSINDLYGIEVFYGDDTANYASKVNASTISDLNIINNNIKMIYHTLEKYPKTMYEPFKNKEYNFDIILLDKFNNNNIALASKNNLKQIKLYVSNAENFERAVHHEIFHIFEYYMSDRNKDIFKEWDELNPKGFKYESNVANLNNKYVYLAQEPTFSNIDDSYFVTKYSKASEKEDRAEVFAEMMMLTSIPDYLKEDTNIRKKADNIVDKLTLYFNIKDLYCTKFLK